MFNSTHTFVGFAIAKTGAGKGVRYGTLTAVIASNLPDIDSIAGFWGTAAYLEHHRGITHSIIGIPLLSLLLAGVMYMFTGEFRRTFWIALLATATHPALDYLNPYGLRPFLPWNRTWYYGDLLFIIDPYLDGILLAGMIAAWMLPHRSRLAVSLSMLVAAGYIGVRIQLHSMAVSQIDKVAAGLNLGEVQKLAAIPNMWNPQRWDALLATPSEVVAFEECAWPCDVIDIPYESIRSETAPPDVIRRALQSNSARALLNFARFPVTRVGHLDSGYRITIYDARFRRRGTVLGSEVILDQTGQVTRQRLSFVLVPEAD